MPERHAVFSPDSNQFLGGWYLRHQNAYARDLLTGSMELILDGVGLGLPGLDCVSRGTDGRVVFSTVSNGWAGRPGNRIYLRHNSLYAREPDGRLSLVVDGGNLNSLDACDLR